MTIDKDTIGTDLDILRDLINKSNDAIFVNDPPTGLFIFVNDKACASLEYDRQELLKMGVTDIETTFPDNFSWQAHVNELRQKGSLIMEGIHKRKNGTTFPVEVNISYVVLNTREYMVAIVRDISERKMAEEEIAERGAMVQQIMDTASVGIGLVNKHGRIIHANRRMAEMFGCTMEELIGSEYVDHVHPSEQETSRRNMLALLASAIPPVELERLYRRKDGTEFWGHLSCRSFHDAYGNQFGLIGVIMDINERKKGEEALRENQARLNLALQSAHMGVWHWDIIENRRYFDDLTCQLLGINEAMFSGTAEEFFRVVDPEDREKIKAAHTRTIKKGVPYESAYRVIWPDGSVRFITARGMLVRNDKGQAKRINGILWDITEQHLLQEERLKLQKIESIGTLAGGIAHDFNNLLQGIFGYISMAKVTFDQKEKALAMLEQAENALHQSVSLTTQLLTFAKGGKPVKQQISLLPVIENAVKFALSGSRCHYQLDIESGLWQVGADGGQLEQVIQNIVLNADHAMPEGGSVVITAKNVLKPDSKHRQLPKGNYVKISIQDSGIGIPKKYLQKIFDPYFTTKEKGSGLGLATSYSIIRNHGGLIDVTSEIGKGTTFFVYLPAIEMEKEFKETDAVSSVVHKGKILVMDDDKVVRNVAKELIKSLGHEVDLAEHGEAAIEKYQAAMESDKPFDIVILDLTVRRGMGGRDTIKALRVVDPGVRAIVSSGYSDDAVVADYEKYGFKARLTKPYKLTGLRETLNALLSA